MTKTSQLTPAHRRVLASFGQDTGAFRVTCAGARDLAEAITAALADLADAEARLQARRAAEADDTNGFAVLASRLGG